MQPSTHLQFGTGVQVGGGHEVLESRMCVNPAKDVHSFVPELDSRYIVLFRFVWLTLHTHTPKSAIYQSKRKCRRVQ